MLAEWRTSILITFEGPEGGGKTTQVKLALDALKALGKDVVATREPGYGSLGKEFRRFLLNPEPGEEPGPMTELMILMADRANHVEKMIRPALNAGQIVLCDRYVDSTRAYQGYGRGIDVWSIDFMNTLVTQECWPDLTLFLDIGVEDGLNRSQDVNRMERESISFHKRVAYGFRVCCDEYQNRVVQVMANRSIEAVHAQVMDNILRKIG